MFHLAKKLKLELSDELTARLKFYASQTRITPEEAVERLLERYLPNPTGGMARTLEGLSEEERLLFKESFYTVMLLVSYADRHISLKESLSAERQLEKLEEFFGKNFAQLFEIPKARREQIQQEIMAMNPADVIIVFNKLRLLFRKMPENLIEEYKIALLDHSIGVASASSEGLFGEKISEAEKNLLRTMMYMLKIPLLGRHTKFLDINFRDMMAFNLLTK